MDLELSIAEAIAIVAATAALAVAGRAWPMRIALPVALATTAALAIVVGGGAGAVVVAASLGLGLLAGAVIRGSVEAREAEPTAVDRTDEPLPGGSPGVGWRNPDELTRREVEVLTLIAAGRSNDEIASELHISMATVKTHVNHIFTKSGVRDRAQAVAYAYEQGLTGSAGR